MTLCANSPWHRHMVLVVLCFSCDNIFVLRICMSVIYLSLSTAKVIYFGSRSQDPWCVKSCEKGYHVLVWSSDLIKHNMQYVSTFQIKSCHNTICLVAQEVVVMAIFLSFAPGQLSSFSKYVCTRIVLYVVYTGRFYQYNSMSNHWYWTDKSASEAILTNLGKWSTWTHNELNVTIRNQSTTNTCACLWGMIYKIAFCSIYSTKSLPTNEIPPWLHGLKLRVDKISDFITSENTRKSC